MYDRFTDRARKVMQLANQEAVRLQHEFIGTEHILLGLIHEGSCVAVIVLQSLDVDLQKTRMDVEKMISAGPNAVETGKVLKTPRAMKVIEYAMEESRNLNHEHLGTEHLLLALLRVQDGVAAQVLMNAGVKLEGVRDQVLKMSGRG